MPTIVEPPADSSADPRPSDEMRRAAEGLNHWSPTGTPADPCCDCGISGAFMDAVADWLDACALVLDVSPATAKAHALRVARAYLAPVA